MNAYDERRFQTVGTLIEKLWCIHISVCTYTVNGELNRLTRKVLMTDVNCCVAKTFSIRLITNQYCL